MGQFKGSERGPRDVSVEITKKSENHESEVFLAHLRLS